ncbi:MAG: SNF2 helicase associated domain-containing protein [Eubacteriales bacterium]
MLQLKKFEKLFTLSTWEKGKQLVKNQKVVNKEIRVGYMDMEENDRCVLSGKVTIKDKLEQTVKVIMDQSELLNVYCECSEYRKAYWSNENTYCKHIAAAIMIMASNLEEQQYDMFTGRTTRTLISKYTQDELTKTKQEDVGEIVIEPLLETMYSQWKLSFKVGKNKRYMIKNLSEFVERVEDHETYAYGKNLKFLHSRDVFHKDSLPILDFIEKRVREFEQYQLNNRFGYYGSMEKYIDLRYHIIDQFFQEIPLESITCTMVNQDDRSKEKRNLIIERENPNLSLRIVPHVMEGEQVEGIYLDLEPIICYEGQSHYYVIQDKTLLISTENFAKNMGPFLSCMEEVDYEGMQVGKSAIGDFYNEVLPRISPYLQIIEEEVELIQSIMPEQPSFAFYFDVLQSGALVCEIRVMKGERELDYWNQAEVLREAYELNKKRIDNILYKYIDFLDKGLLVFQNDEELHYDFLQNGIHKLREIGEVHVTDNVMSLSIRKAPKLAIGISVKSGLLEFNMDTDDIQLEELNAILDSYKSKKKYHKLKDGSFLTLEDSNFHVMEELMEGLQLTSKDLLKEKIHIPTYRALYIDKILGESQGVEYNRDNTFKDIVRNFKVIEDTNYKVPKELKSIIRTYQKTGYRWLRMLKDYQFGGILADDMGLGKTLQVITMLLSYKQEGESGTTLIITPASLVYNWENECKKFAPSLRVGVLAGMRGERESILQDSSQYEVLITSYELLRRDIELYEEKEFFYEILDEAQYIKNHTTQISKAVKTIRSKYRLALTGTPVENRLSELWSIFDFIMPGFLYTYDKFRKGMETHIVKSKDEEVMDRLKKMVNPFIMRRLKKDVLKDLPDKIEETTFAKLEKKQMEVYSAYAKKVKMELAQQSSEEFQKGKLKILAELTRLRQLCCDPQLVYSDYDGSSGKLETCMELLQNASEGEHKVLVFSQFTSMLEIIGQRLQKEGLEYYEITGATPKAKRVQLVDQFNQNKVPVFLISLKAGGTGLNLTGADMVIHYDPWWNVAAQNQATDRAHRIGQKQVVTVFQLIAKDTIEEKILEMQERKRELAEQVINGDANQLSGMGKDDFMELLQ